MGPELDLARLRQWADHRVSPRARDQVRIELDVSDRALTIMECRPPWHPDIGPQWTRFPIARLRYTKTHGEWTLYWRDRNLRFHRYPDAEPTADVMQLIAVVDENRTGIFWG